jgi:hypothetical protein
MGGSERRGRKGGRGAPGHLLDRLEGREGAHMVKIDTGVHNFDETVLCETAAVDDSRARG